MAAGILRIWLVGLIALAALGFGGHQTWRQVDFSSQLSVKAPPAVVSRGALATLEFDEWNTLPGIGVPTLVMAGENDRVTRFDANVRIQERIPGAKLVPFRPAGHYALLEHHGAVNREVAGFVEAFGTGSSRSVPPPHVFGRAATQSQKIEEQES